MRPWTNRVEVYFGEGAEAYVTPGGHEPRRRRIPVRRAPRARDRGEAVRRAPREVSNPRRAPRQQAHRLATPRCRSVRAEGRPARRRQRAPRRRRGGNLDPLTGEGVALGLATAEAAISSILEEAPGAYEMRYQRLTRRYFAMTLGLLAIARRRRLHAPMLRLARAMPRAFDAALGTLAHLRSADDANAPAP